METRHLITRRHTACASSVALERVARVAVAVLLAATFMMIAIGAMVEPAVPPVSSWADVSVPENGTLWELAATHRAAGRSVAETVDLIQTENNLPSSTVYAGQSVRVPSNLHYATTVASR